MHNLLYNKSFSFLYFFRSSPKFHGVYLLDNSLCQFLGFYYLMYLLSHLLLFCHIYIYCFEASRVSQIVFFYFQLQLTYNLLVLPPLFPLLPFGNCLNCASCIGCIVGDECIIFYIFVIFHYTTPL